MPGYTNSSDKTPGSGKKRNKKKRKNSANSPNNNQPEKRQTVMSASQHTVSSPVYPEYTMNNVQSSPGSQAHVGQHVPPHLQFLASPPTLPPSGHAPPISYVTPGSGATGTGSVQMSNEPPWVKTLFAEIYSIKASMSKLDKIESDVANISHNMKNVEVRVNLLETKLSDQCTELNGLKCSRDFDSKTCDELKKANEKLQHDLKTEISKRDELSDKFENVCKEKNSLQEDIIDLKGRSMRDNLLFYNIDEEPDRESRKNENCSEKVLNYCVDRIGIVDAFRYKIDRAHRVGDFTAGKKRPVVAKFNYYPDKVEVKERARQKFSSGDQNGVSDQYPPEIRERRQKLIPYLVQARKEKKTAVLSYDTLYINNRPYTANNPPPGPVPTLAPRGARRQSSIPGGPSPSTATGTS